MTGRYLRRKKPGSRDPTMTHVDDPWAFRPGDWIRSYEGWRFIYSIERIDADTCFIELRRGGDDRRDFDHFLPDPGAVHPSLADMRIFDFRPLDVENFRESAITLDGKPFPGTMEEARRELERTLSEHMTGFVE